ncbi:hypothetical protein ALP53_200031 [Pseudomonas savastanoi pv. phaseolicola]|nr:hypothetical protein ALP53_200031 [Pseudomonas savastanoi pv. phaseolicola]
MPGQHVADRSDDDQTQLIACPACLQFSCCQLQMIRTTIPGRYGKYVAGSDFFATLDEHCRVTAAVRRVGNVNTDLAEACTSDFNLTLCKVINLSGHPAIHISRSAISRTSIFYDAVSEQFFCNCLMIHSRHLQSGVGSQKFVVQ